MTKQATAPKGKITPAVKSAPAKPAAKSAPVKKAGVADAIVAALTKKTAPATKPAEKKDVKPAAAAKPAVEKPASVPLLTSRATKGQTIHVISETARPGSGKALRAHTHAALTVLGMLQPSRPAAQKRAVLTIMGQRAVTYHLGEGNFEDAPDSGLRLTAEGLAKFQERAKGSLDAKMANSFVGMFLEGKTDGTGIATGNVYQAKF